MTEITCNTCKKDCAAEHTIFYKGSEASKYYCYPCSTTDPWKIFDRTGDLTTRIIMDANLKCYVGLKGNYPYGEPSEIQKKVNSIYLKFKDQIKRFEDEVWIDGMRSTMMASNHSGMCCEADEIKLLTFCTGGRCMIDIHIGDEHISFLTVDNASENHCMGLQGIYGKEEPLSAAIEKVIALWKAGKLTLKDDVQVGLGF